MQLRMLDILKEKAKLSIGYTYNWALVIRISTK